MNEKLDCRICIGKCNKKGYPSITKNSSYCEKQRDVILYTKIDFWHRIKNFVKTLERGFRK